MLASIPLFYGLDPETREVVKRHSALRSVRRNTVVIQKGDESGALYVVISGRLKVSVADEQGKEVILNTLGPGDYFGELAILGDTPRTATVVSLEDSNLLTLSRMAFLELVREQPDIALAVIRNLTARVAQLTEQVGRLALGDVYSRIRDLLNEHAVEEEQEAAHALVASAKGPTAHGRPPRPSATRPARAAPPAARATPRPPGSGQ